MPDDPVIDNTLPDELPPEDETVPEPPPADPDNEPVTLPALEPVPPGGNERGKLPPSAFY
jgi:hypothetical protein